MRLADGQRRARSSSLGAYPRIERFVPPGLKALLPFPATVVASNDIPAATPTARTS